MVGARLLLLLLQCAVHVHCTPRVRSLINEQCTGACSPLALEHVLKRACLCSQASHGGKRERDDDAGVGVDRAVKFERGDIG